MIIIDALYGALNTASMEVIYNLTEVGSKTSYLDFMTSRYETQTLDLQERQVKVEGADAAKTIIEFKSQEVAYNAALQMGTMIIQPSILILCPERQAPDNITNCGGGDFNETAY